MKRAFVTGVTGQDGSYLSELLLSLGYEVHGMIRASSSMVQQSPRLAKCYGNPNFHTHYGDMTDPLSLERILREVMPDEVYNLAAQSHVRISFDVPQFTVHTDAVGVINLLESMRRICPTARFYQASSSEMFGLSVDADGYQREGTPLNPVSPYGCSKVFAYNVVRHYRRAYGMHLSNGILFNHESPRRGVDFVTNKVVKGAAMIAYGKQVGLELGNLDASRDWGHAKDYVKVMHSMLQQSEPSDYVCSMMETHTVRELCEFVFGYFGLDYRDHVTTNPKYLRSEELPYLKGDSTRLRSELGWEPTYTFESMLTEMCEHWEDVIFGVESTR
jgi:GDPmannose 4,6-dehydratase